MRASSSGPVSSRRSRRSPTSPASSCPSAAPAVSWPRPPT
nr:MAG TPA: hypothetical protein [Caudoviricetes sp.]